MAICAACGSENRERQKFCGECGAALVTLPPTAGSAGPSVASAGLEGERKQLTVLFADVQGSMDLQEDLDPEEWAGIMDRLVKILAEGVCRFGGTIDKFTGDGIMALFGAPLAQEDHARRACQAAWNLAGAIADSAGELSLRGVQLHVRLGLNSGEVVVGRVGGDVCLDPTALGHTVGLAQRMEALAEPGRVYLSEHTARLVKGWFRLSDLGPLAVKGARRPLRVFVLEGPVSAPPTARSLGDCSLVGRGEELAALEGALAAAGEGHAVVVGVVGEAGVGKSRLCEEFARAAAERGCTVRRTAGVSHAQSVPLLPILALVRALFAITESDSPEQARAEIRRRLVEVDPSLEQTLQSVFDFLGVSDPDQPSLKLAPEVLMGRILGTLRQMTQHQSEQEVLVLVVEDLHWFDTASQAFLAGLIESLQGSRTLVLANFRPEFSAPWMGSSGFRRLPLAPLVDEAAGELLSTLLGVDPSLTPLVFFILERTGGNPFFIEEVVRTLAEEGTLSGSSGAYRLTRPLDQVNIPPGVHAVLAARIDRLPPEHKEVLQTAAVLGRTFAGAVLSRVFGADVDLDGAIRGLCAAEMIQEVHTLPSAEYRFWHPLTQEVAYDTLLGQRRALLHGAVARAIVEIHPGVLDERAALTATHFERAGDDLEAARWNSRAATWALRSDVNDAMGRWRAVLTQLDRLEETEEVLRLGITARSLLMQWGIRTAMSVEEAETLLAGAVERADRLADPVQHCLLRAVSGSRKAVLGELRVGSQMMVDAARLADRLGEPGLMAGVWFCAWTEGLDEGLRLAERAIEHCHGDPDVGIQRIGYSALVAGLLARAELLARMGRLTDARESAARALALAEERSQSELVLRILSLSPRLALYGGEDDGESLHRANKAVTMAEASGNVVIGLMALTAVAIAELVGQRWDAAADAIHRALEQGRRWRLPWQDADLLTQLALVELGRARAEAAVRAATEAVAIAVAQGADVFECAARLALGRAIRQAGEAAGTAQAETELRRALALVNDTGATTLEPFIREELGRLRDDEPELQEALRLFTAIGAAGHAQRLQN